MSTISASDGAPLVKYEPQEIAQVRPTDLLSAIAAAVADPRIDVDKMERLLSMHQQIVKDNREVAFKEALAQLQAELPHIAKDGKIIVKGQERSRYSKIETIDRAIRPLLEKYGFSLSFDSDSQDAKMFRLSCTLAHKAGHDVTKHVLLPIDASDFRSNVQSIGSTVSYGRRTLIKMHLNLIEDGEDDDGNGGLSAISADQVKDLETMLADVKGDMKMFLEYMGVPELKDIRVKDWQKAVTAIEAKRKRK